MAYEEAFRIDTKDFEEKFLRIVKSVVPNILCREMESTVGPEVIRDCIVEEPTVPKRTGNLRRRQKIGKAKVTSGALTLEVGFNTEYASFVHEAPSNLDWSEPGSGPKFLSSKLSWNRDKYMKLLADKVKEAKG